MLFKLLVCNPPLVRLVLDVLRNLLVGNVGLVGSRLLRTPFCLGKLGFVGTLSFFTPRCLGRLGFVGNLLFLGSGREFITDLVS